MNILSRALRPPENAAAERQEAHQSRAAGRRRARRVHLGRARRAAGRRADRDRGHVRHLGRRDQRRDGGRRARPRRPGGGAQAPRRFLARGEPRRRDVEAQPRHLRAAVLADPDRRRPDEGLVRHHVELSVALRSQPAQHQSAEGPDRPLRRFRRGEEERHAAVHRGDQCAHRPAARVPAREDRRRRGDGLGGAALRVQGGRDRRRALLGRRLHRQPADLSVLPHHRHRGRAGGADQSGAAGVDAADVAGDRQPHQRDHVQRLADRGIPRHRVRAPADRRGRAQARHRAGRIPPHQRAPRRSRLHRQEADAAEPAQHRLRFLRDAAPRRPPRRAALPRPAFRRHRRALDDRPARRDERREATRNCRPAWTGWRVSFRRGYCGSSPAVFATSRQRTTSSAISLPNASGDDSAASAPMFSSCFFTASRDRRRSAPCASCR